MNKGEYAEAVTLAKSIETSALRGALLIDAGAESSKSTYIREGIQLLEELRSANDTSVSRESLLYSLANGYSALYTIRRRRRPTLIPTNDDDLRVAKRLYRAALAEAKTSDRVFRSQLWVNYGNCLSSLGRTIEAIDCYHLALEAEPENGMAAGNLGVELEHFAVISGRYPHDYLFAAHEALTKSLSPASHLRYGGPATAYHFNRIRDRLKRQLDAHEGLEPPKPVELPNGESETAEYLSFCVTNRLFLNAWVGDPNVAPAISDEIVFRPITTALGDETTVPELLHILNEAKEAFATARYQFFLSQASRPILDTVSELTLYFDIDAGETHGIYNGLCKAAYTRAFDILDKVARIVNCYFKIGQRRDAFWEVFAEKQSRGETHELRYIARPAIAKTHNFSLYALADLCIDYFESEHVDFKTIDRRRNLITHDYLAVLRDQNIGADRNDNEIDREQLRQQTLSVLTLAKYAILYVVNAVHTAEWQKGDSGKVVRFVYDVSPGE